VKLIATVSFLLASLLLTSAALAQVQYYGVDTILDKDGRASIKLTVTFSAPETSFEFSIFGRIEKLNVTSTAGPPSCSLIVSGTSFVRCKLSLTEDKRTVELSFETEDFVKALDDKFYFDADLGLGKEIDSMFVSVRLPEGTALVGGSEEYCYPANATIVSDGRHHIVTWRLYDIPPNQPLRFQILYEKVQFFQQPQVLLYMGVFAVAAALSTSFVYLRFFRKSEKLILSVLDDFEKRVMDVIIAAGGIVNQKKIVQETNLSKAKVSRVVKSLAERGLIEVERLGRTNRLKVAKRKFKLF